MAVYLIERNFAEQILDAESVAPAINQVNAEAGAALGSVFSDDGTA